MYFRNVFAFRFPIDGFAGVDELEAGLRAMPLREPGPLEMATDGFTDVLGTGHWLFIVEHFALISFGQNEKIMPAAVINDELAHKVAELAEQEGRRVGGRERKRMRDEVITTLLPRAFTRHRRSLAYFDLRDGYLMIDTATRGVAEMVVSKIREALGSFPCTPLTPEESPRSILTQWVMSGKLPDGFVLGDEIELRDPAAAASVLRARRQDLETDEIREHLKTGKQVFLLGLTFDDRLSLTLGEDLTIRRLRLLDQVLEEMGETSDGTAATEVAARLTLMAFELRRLFDQLAAVFVFGRDPSLVMDGGDAPPHMRDRGAPEDPFDKFANVTDEQLQAALERDPGMYAVIKKIRKAREKKASTFDLGTIIKAVDISQRLSDTRRFAKVAFGDKYAAEMESAIAVIQERASETSQNPTAAAMALVNEAPTERNAIRFLAALCEIMNPELQPDTAAPKLKPDAQRADSLRSEHVEESLVVRTNDPDPDDVRVADRSSVVTCDHAANMTKWMETGERGASSNTIFAALSGSPVRRGSAHPLDPADLRRCRLLLETVPGFVPMFPKMADISTQWGRFVEAWSVLCGQFDAECPDWRTGKGAAPQTYEMMKTLGR